MAISKITSDAIDATGFNLDSNTLTIDATNNRVGIGTASPSSDLHVVAGAAGDSVCKLVDNGGFGFNFIPRTGGSGAVNEIRTGSGESISISTSNTERMRIKSDGAITTGGTNISVLSGSSSVTLADDASYTISASGTATAGGCLLCIYEVSSGDNALFHTGYNSSTILSTANNAYGFSVSDTDGKICIIKSAHNLTLKNRAGVSRTFKVAIYGAGAQDFNL